MSKTADRSETSSVSSPTASGVEALIEKLRDEGLEKGKAAAEKLIADAQSRADWLLEQAQMEADKHIAEARAEAERLKLAGQEALKVAARDTVLQTKSALTTHFTDEVARLVSEQLQDEAVLKDMIIEIVRRVADQITPESEGSVELILPRDTVGLEELRSRPAEIKEGPLSQFVLATAGESLRNGLTLALGPAGQIGIKVRLVEQNVELDLTDQGVSELLLQHLQPRFRALLEGIVH
ncbi:MAG: hypothetical protein SVU69_08020 [Pseudomonadota bacterium]|nr:hypothetical protein [Pseudomonadota bacterium]